MRILVIAITLGLVAVHTAPADAEQFSAGRELRLSFNTDGTVNLVARNVTARDILAEWARHCQCYVVNAEQLSGGAIMLPLQFESARQSDVLRSLLRSAAGYVLTPQRAGAQGASHYETIFILATSNPVAGAYVPPPAPPVSALPTMGSPDDELPPVVPIPVQSSMPPQGPPPGGATPSNPFGSRTNSPFVSITPVPGPATAPGMPVPNSGSPPQPPPPGTVVPIVPVPSNP
jgi:hypothetical protein